MTTPFIINHLWQSSCFALLAGLLAFVLRKNSPKVRYWVWLSASLKFLIPFALLVKPRKCGSASNSAPGVCCGSCFPEHPRSNRGTVFAGSSFHLFQRMHHCDWAPVVIGVVWAPRVFGNHAGTMPQLVRNSSSTASQHAR